jgi:acetyl esterase/lipase
MRAAIVGFGLVLTMGCGPDFETSTVAWDQRYGAEGTLDLYVPLGEARDRPAVLILHHGGWNGGDKSTLKEQAARLARSGFVVANANYRLAPKVHFPAPVQDAQCALAFMRTHAEELHLDPQRIAVLGYSAGANLAELVGMSPVLPGPASDCPHGLTDGPAAVIAGAGPVDLLHLPSLGDPALAEFIGKSKTEAPELYRAASAITHAAPGKPPFLLIHGTGDVYVPSGQARELRDALAAHGNDVSLLLLAGSGHTFNPGSEPGAGNFGDLVIDGPEAWRVLVAFLHRTIGEPAP